MAADRDQRRVVPRRLVEQRPQRRCVDEARGCLTAHHRRCSVEPRAAFGLEGCVDALLRPALQPAVDQVDGGDELEQAVGSCKPPRLHRGIETGVGVVDAREHAGEDTDGDVRLDRHRASLVRRCARSHR